MIANIRHAARSAETVTIGGGEFRPAEVRKFAIQFDELTDQLYACVPYLEDALDDPCYKPLVVKQRIDAIKKLLERIES